MANENCNLTSSSEMALDHCIKSEITFEEERITDTKFLDLPTEMVYQVEVGCLQVDTSSPINNIGEMCELQRNPEEQTAELNESVMSDALNDHNYTSQEIVISQPKLDNVKDVLLSHIFSNGQSLENLPVSVSNFIDNTISKIRILQLECINKSTEEPLPTECSSKNDDDTNLPTTCSEPLEIEPYDEYFENLYNNINEDKTTLNTFLSETKDCAKEIYNECSLQQTEEEFKSFILEKIGNLKKIVNVINTNDQSVQTISTNHFMKKHRLNYNAKRSLQDTSESSDMKSDRSVSDAESKSDSISNRNSCQRLTKKKDLKKEIAYDDGIDLSKFVKFEITNRKLRHISSELKSEASTYSSDDNTDKEIERLTNLSGLKKRHVINGTPKLTNRSKPKKLQVKEVNFLNESDVDSESNDAESYKPQSDTEVITEHQYLSRFNEQVKNELLNESNSDSGLSDQSEYNLSKESSSTENEEKRTCVVDKFLEVFQPEDDDDDEDDNDGDEDDIKDEGNNENKSEVEQLKESDSFDVSDELWNDNCNQKKKSKKSLEKLRAEAEKRNHDEEIVLSSESEFSEVEPEPQQEKNRLIKPMLRLDQLASETRVAQKSETERIRRLEKKHTILSKAIKNSPNSVSKNSLILDYIEKTKTFIKVDEEILKHLKPHQIDGVKFMYDSCYGGIDHTKKSSGSGCILAHCMGLGKTLQLIALLHTVVSYKELNTTKVLVLCPKSTVMNWADEMHRWLGPLKRKTHMKVFVFPDASDISDKLRILEEWSAWSLNKAGCLLVGYEAFRTLVFYHSYKNRGNLSSAKLEIIRDKVNKYLLQPGADLVVCDEGHVIKNSKSAISLAVAKIVTPKRIMLTGTPIQNHLKEYYSMVNFIKPLYLGTEKEFANLYCNPIKNGQHKDSSKKDITVMKQRSFVLHKKLSKFVQRKEAELLKTFLPQKFEYVLFIPMTSVQNTLYEYILEAIASRGDSRGKSLITDYTVLRKIWTHPKVLEDAWKNANMQKNKKDIKKPGCPNSDDDQPDDIYDSQTGLISVNNDWWRKYLSKKDLETIMPSNKLRTVFSILRMCEEKGEKCLIFSAFVAVLNVVEYFFKKITQNDPEILQHLYVPSNIKPASTWISGQDYYRLDGKTPKNIRHEMIKRFNSEANRRARVFLISAKAGGQGINLIGANRVIILDTSWNPSNDQQNIFRIFRLGQKKNCYIYRLIAMGTMEEKVYSRSVTKQAMSFRVVDEQQIDRHYNMAELAELYTLTYPKQSERPYPLLPKDTILAHLLRQSELVYKYHEHDSLLENKVEQELSEQEKADAWDTYERELQMNLAQQEGSNAEKNPNSVLPSKLNSYFGAVPPGLDMQALLNYSLQSSSLMQPYNYGLNQNYIDYLNLYQKCSSLRYPEMNACLNDTSLAASLFGVGTSPNLNHMQSPASILSSMQSLSGSKTHPKDFNMFDAQKNRTNPLAHPALHPTTSTESTANLSNIVTSLGQYKQLLENPLGNLLNYSNQSYSTPGQAESLLANMKASLPSDLYPEKILETGVTKEKPGRPKSSGDQGIINKGSISQDLRATTTVDLTPTSTPSLAAITPFDRNMQALRKQNPLSTTSVDLTSNPSVKNPLPPKKTPPLPPVQRQINLVNDDDRNHKNPNTGSSNFPSGFPVDKGSSLLSKTFPKTDMQIIPTNSPPGTISITKQLNEMSPSISLTAVNPPNEKSRSQSQLIDKMDKLINNGTTVSTASNRQATANVFKPRKPSNPNLFPLPKASTLTNSQKVLTGKDKSVPILVSQTKKMMKEYSSMLRTEIGKSPVTKALSKPETSSPSIIGSIDSKTLNQKSSTETGLSITKTSLPSQISNTNTPANIYTNVKSATGTSYSSTPPMTNIRTTKAISAESGFPSNEHRNPNIVNLAGDNQHNLAKKRPTESAGNLSIKRTKM